MPWRGRLPFARAVIPVPSYTDYAAAVQAAGREVCFVKLEESDDFALDWQAVGSSSFTATRSCCWASRTIPRAGPSTAMHFCDLAARHPATTFVVDEAFADFIEGYRSLAERPPANVIVVRSLTKFYAIPGLRLGFAVASGDCPADPRARFCPGR